MQDNQPMSRGSLTPGRLQSIASARTLQTNPTVHLSRQAVKFRTPYSPHQEIDHRMFQRRRGGRAGNARAASVGKTAPVGRPVRPRSADVSGGRA